MYSDGVKLGHTTGGVPIPPLSLRVSGFKNIFEWIIYKLFNRHKKPNQRFVEGFYYLQF